MSRKYRDYKKEIENGELAVVTDVQRFTVHDGPGIRTMIFFKGCPLRCRWCQNPETWHREPELMYFKENCIGCGNCQKACPTGALKLTWEGVKIDNEKCRKCGNCADHCYPGALKVSGRLMSVEEAFETAMKDEVFYRKSGGGVTLSGGECTTYARFIEQLLTKLQDAGVHTAIETCGFCRKEDFRKIIEHVDLLLFDIKVPREKLDQKYTGRSCRPILENLKMTRGLGKKVILRYPMIPEVNDDEETLEVISETAKDNHISDIHILPFHQMGLGKWNALSRDYSCEEKESPSEEKIDMVQSFLCAEGLNATVGGADA